MMEKFIVFLVNGDKPDAPLHQEPELFSFVLSRFLLLQLPAR
jgi:hypothetical protein